ncbi:MAG: M64 family metallopeptidase [Acidobacteriota bacterium]|nr:M64 family metallopeptidase [Acidobacteriota bacterium]
MRIAAAALAALGLSLASTPPAFEDYFEPRTLRVDLVRAGTAEEDAWSLLRLTAEGAWAGPRQHLLDPHDLGGLRVALIEPQSGQRVYSRGFSSLFDEWQTTAEAGQGRRRAMVETLRLPLPRIAMELVIEARGEQGFARVFRWPLDPAAPVSPAPPPPPYEKLVIRPGPPLAEAVDLLIVGDGYPDLQREKFRRDAERLIRALLAVSPFTERQELLQVTALRATGGAVGPAEPRKGLFPPGSLTAFDTFGSPRYLLPHPASRLQDLAGAVPHDLLVVMVNAGRYGGGGLFGGATVFTADGEYPEALFIHEFGHGLGGLGDEYFSSQVAYEEFYPAGREPWEPNLSASPRRDSLAWADLVAPDTPLPTPDLPAFDGVVGAFEGAGYLPRGLYRPWRRCRMKDKGAESFCPVCRRALAARLDFLADRPLEKADAPRRQEAP